METEARIAAVILGAGASSRFGVPKATVRVGSRTMLGVAVDTATAAGLAPVLAVLPRGVPEPATVTAVRNDAPHLGMSRSLRLGLAAVPPSADAAVILLVDQPTVDPALLRRIVGARGRTAVVATRASGIIGPPALLEREAFDLVESLEGDVGLRDLVRRQPALATPVDAEAPIPDVDTPADLDLITEACPGCGARHLPHAIDETHAYIGASAACWAAYGELLAREFEDPSYGGVHRHSADVYAVQHPGTDGRRQRQSVAVHLIALCRWIEDGWEIDRLNAETQRLASASVPWPWLAPPTSYPMTVLDVLDARTGAEHVDLVRRWAESTWEAWSAHHGTVRSLRTRIAHMFDSATTRPNR